MIPSSLNPAVRQRRRRRVFSSARIRHNRMKFMDLIKGHTSRHERVAAVSRYLQSVLGKRWLRVLSARKVVSPASMTSWLIGEVTPSKAALKRVEDYACSIGYTTPRKRDGVKAKQATVEVEADSATQALGVLQDLAGQQEAKDTTSVALSPPALENENVAEATKLVESQSHVCASVSSIGVSITNLPSQRPTSLSSSIFNDLQTL
jgi:hypothetical protein